MSQRLEFTPADVARVRVEPSLGPFAETVLAYSALREPAGRRNGGPAPLHAASSRQDQAMAAFLWLSRSTAFDLFSVVGRSRDLADSRERLMSADSEEVAIEADYWASLHHRARDAGLPAQPRALDSTPLAGLRSGTEASRALLFGEIAGFHQRLFGNHWAVIAGHLAAAQALLEERLVAGGVELLLGSLGAQVRWTGDALELPLAGIGLCDSSRPVAGRGVRVIPSYFAIEPQVYWPEDPAAALLLLVPTRRKIDLDGNGDISRSGEQLLGRTRTAVLATVARRPCTTTELGTALDISISGASQHASVLRRAGLVTSVRDGSRVVHRITALGDELLSRLTE